MFCFGSLSNACAKSFRKTQRMIAKMTKKGVFRRETLKHNSFS